MKDLPHLFDSVSRMQSLKMLGLLLLLLGCFTTSGCRSEPLTPIPETSTSPQPLNPALPSEDEVEAPGAKPQPLKSPSSLPGTAPRPRDPAIVPPRRTPIPTPEPSGPALAPFPPTLPERTTPIPTPESTSNPGLL